MITLSILQSVEFYVVASVVAAAVIALCIRPPKRGEAQTMFVAGELFSEPEPYDGPSLDIDVRNDGAVEITRHGLNSISTDSRISLAITLVQFDISIQERVAEIPGFEKANAARFVIVFLGAERYHLTYNVEHTSLFTSASVKVRPGIHIHRSLTL